MKVFWAGILLFGVLKVIENWKPIGVVVREHRHHPQANTTV